MQEAVMNEPVMDELVDLGPLEMTRIVVGPMANNAYLLRERSSGTLVLIDAAAEPERLLGALRGAPLAAVVTTHRHADHVGALAAVVTATGAATAAGGPDADALPVPTDTRLDDGDTVAVGEVSLAVVRLTGHTPGGIALVHDAQPGGGVVHVFTGDSLFPGGVGRTGSPEAFTTLLADVRTRLFDPLPDDTRVWPGHGEPTTLGAERPELASWAERGW